MGEKFANFHTVICESKTPHCKLISRNFSFFTLLWYNYKSCKVENASRSFSFISFSWLCKIYIFQNQTLESMANLESLTKLHTIQMEGNPVWSLPDYSNYVVSSLPHLKVLDQQEISAEISEVAAKWKSSQASVMTFFLLHY